MKFAISSLKIEEYCCDELKAARGPAENILSGGGVLADTTFQYRNGEVVLLYKTLALKFCPLCGTKFALDGGEKVSVNEKGTSETTSIKDWHVSNFQVL